MKIFSLLLLQCKKPSCRMVSYLVPKDCEVSIAAVPPQKKDVELMDAQSDTICSMEINNNEFILPKIIESIRCTCKVIGDGYPEEMVFMPEEMQVILDGPSIMESIGEKRTEDLFNTLFNVEMDNGGLVCVQCSEVYPIVNRIVDFVKLDDY